MIDSKISVYTMLEEATNKFYDHTAIVDANERITYSELKQRVDHLANAWKRIGFKKGERIGLMIGNNINYIVSYYAALKIGLIVVQINPRYTTRELSLIVEDSSISYMVAERDNVEKITEVNKKYHLKNIFYTTNSNNDCKSLHDLIRDSKPLSEAESIDPLEDIAVIQYTGGTSGAIKGAMLTHDNLVSNVIQSKIVYGNKMLFGEEVFLGATPLYHVYGMTSAMNLGLYMGAKIILLDDYNVTKLLNIIEGERVTFLPGVPKFYSDIANYENPEEIDLSSLKICSCGSAPLPVEVINRFEQVTNSIIVEGFGLSEASPSTHRNPIEGERKPGSIGLPLPETLCKIVDDNDKELNHNEVGELIIKGPQVMKGYWENEAETAEALKNGWLYTGDLAKYDEDGYFYIVGRKKEMIITGGFNVYPQEVENVIYDYPSIKEVAVLGVEDEDKGEAVKAFVVPHDGENIDLKKLQDHCYKNLTPYKVPRTFEIIDSLPRNTVGKILKRELQ